MTARPVLYLLLAVVAAAAAVLSFAALRDLALLCGFATWLAWLLPVVVDAGAAAGSLVWLGGWGDIRARRFGRRLALVLLGASVAANALSHGLAAYHLAPAWWVVVVVSGVAPAVLGAVVHLAVLVGRVAPAAPGATVAPPVATPVVDEVAGEPETGGDESATLPAPVFVPLAAVRAATRSAQVTTLTPPAAVAVTDVPDEVVETAEAKRARLLAEGAGRKRLARELGIKEHEARRLLARGGDRVAAPGERVASPVEVAG